MIKYNRSFLVDGGCMALIEDDIDTIIFYTFETNIKDEEKTRDTIVMILFNQ